jgi:hypothetical protein
MGGAERLASDGFLPQSCERCLVDSWLSGDSTNRTLHLAPHAARRDSPFTTIDCAVAPRPALFRVAVMRIREDPLMPRRILCAVAAAGG